MKSEHGATITTVQFDNVPCGECFYYNGALYLKVNYNSAYNFAFETLSPHDFEEMVIPVKTKLVVEEY